MFKEIDHEVVYPMQLSKNWVIKWLFTRSGSLSSIRSFFLSFFMGKIPEWRGSIHQHGCSRTSNKFSCVYAFVYSPECMKYAHWISKKRSFPLLFIWQTIRTSLKKPGSSEILQGIQTHLHNR